MATLRPSAWPLPPQEPALAAREIHVWLAPIDASILATAQLEQTLTADEREKARRFVFEKDRQRFMICRGLLRCLLARYVSKEPSEIRLVYNAHGKPALNTPRLDAGPCFNLSHSGEFVLYAFTLGREVGVDIEQMRSVADRDRVAESVFSPAELAQFQSLHPDRKEEAFFNCWTRKEAYIKARGKGLSIPLDKFDVSFIPGERARLVQTRDEPTAVDQWEMMELLPAPGYAAALVAEGRNWDLRCWRLDDQALGP